MNSDATLKNNVALWSKLEPEAAEQILTTDASSISLCNAESGVQNLKITHADGVSYVHDQNDPLLEAERWKQTLDLRGTNVLFVYGIGLGYYFDTLKEWLKESENHYLVFIENDLKMLRALFESDYGERLLKNKQVRIYYFEDFKKSSAKFDEVSSNFIGLTFKVSAITYYLKDRARDLIHLNTVLSFLMKIKMAVNQEFNALGQQFYKNFYTNLFTLPESYLAKSLWGQFEGVPAIICGAGPSLEKNIGVLKELQNKALIFGGSTSINALNAGGVMPHFGVGIDPNPVQLMRIVTNHAFNVPFFINFRMDCFSVPSIQGDHLYVNSGANYKVADWFDKQLGIEGKSIAEGFNVVNFSLSIAKELGCNPIIITGVDLAYTKGESYAKLTPPHPLYIGASKFLTKNPQEDLVAREDINGENIFTLWKWLLESVWFSKFAMEQHIVDIINATEGGLGFPGVVNMTLKEVADKHLQCTYDFEGIIHSAIQNGAMPDTVTHESIINSLEAIHTSMTTCTSLCEKIVVEYKEIVKAIGKGNEFPKNLITPKITEIVIALDQELGNETVLSFFNEHLQNVMGREIQKLEIDDQWLSKEEIFQQHAELHAMRYEYLEVAAKRNNSFLTHALEMHRTQMQKKQHNGNVDQSKIVFKELSKSPKEIYALKDGVLTIIDPALGLSYSEPFDVNVPENHTQEYYPNGSIKSDQYYHERMLHGPSIFYSVDGKILAKAWYLNGKKVGRSYNYYGDGTLYSTTVYKNGVFHGPQDYYFPQGFRRTHLNYTEGVLDGPVYLFYSNGQIKRELHFKNGKRDGNEFLWNYDGMKIGEAHYDDDKPIGDAIFWDPNGVMLKKTQFNQDGDLIKTYLWNDQGQPIEVNEFGGRDYFDVVALKMEGLTKNLDQITSSLEGLLPVLSNSYYKVNKGEVDSLKKGINSVKDEISRLKVLNEKMIVSTGMNPNDPKEAIWKTPAMQQLFQDSMEKATVDLKNNVETIQGSFISMMENIKSEFAEDDETKVEHDDRDGDRQ